MIESNQQKLNLLLKRILKENNGDLKASFIILYDEIINCISKDEFTGILKNLFIYIHSRKKDIDHIENKIYEVVKGEISHTGIKTNRMDVAFKMLMHTLLSSVAEAMKNDDINNIKKQYLQKIDIICYGIYKEEKK